MTQVVRQMLTRFYDCDYHDPADAALPTYLNRTTGELFAEEPDDGLYEAKRAIELCRDQRRTLRRRPLYWAIQRSLLGHRSEWVALPALPPDYGWPRLLRRFAETLPEGQPRDKLLHMIATDTGPFFEDVLREHRLYRKWTRFRDQEVGRFAAEWLRTSRIVYQD